MTATTLTHDERSMKQVLVNALLPESRPAAGVLGLGIQSPDGTRVADAIWAPHSRNTGIEGYEIKVSRSDVMAELRDPAKTEPWQRYCTRWWLFVSDPTFIEGLNIPEHWGVVAPPSGRRRVSLTVVRQAPRLHPVDTGEAWQRLHVWYAFRHADRTQAHARQVQDLNKQIQHLREQTSAVEHRKMSPYQVEMATLYRRLDERLSAAGIRPTYRSSEVEDAIIDVMVDHVAAAAHTKNRLRAVAALLDNVDRLLKGLKDNYEPDGIKRRIAALSKDLGASQDEVDEWSS